MAHPLSFIPLQHGDNKACQNGKNQQPDDDTGNDLRPLLIEHFSVLLTQNLFNGLFSLGTGQHHFMFTARTTQFDIHTHPEDRPDLAATGVGLFHFYSLIKLQIHKNDPPFPF